MNIIDLDKHRKPYDAVKELEERFDAILATLDKHTPYTREMISKIKADAQARYRTKHRVVVGVGSVGAAIVVACILGAGYLDFVHASGNPIYLPFFVGVSIAILAWTLEHRSAKSRDDTVGICEPAYPDEIDRIAKLAKKSADVRRIVTKWIAINPELTRREVLAVNRCINRLRELEPSLNLNRALRR